MEEINRVLKTIEGTVFASGCTRIVRCKYPVGDMVEFKMEHVVQPMEAFKRANDGMELFVKPVDRTNSLAKDIYQELRINDGSNTKISYQLQPVSYGNLRPNHHYVALEDVLHCLPGDVKIVNVGRSWKLQEQEVA